MCRQERELGVDTGEVPVRGSERINYAKIPSVTEDELLRDIDAILKRVNQGESPILICCNSGSKLLLFSWEDYWNRYAALYPEGERERVEEACRQADRQEGTSS